MLHVAAERAVFWDRKGERYTIKFRQREHTAKAYDYIGAHIRQDSEGIHLDELSSLQWRRNYGDAVGDLLERIGGNWIRTSLWEDSRGWRFRVLYGPDGQRWKAHYWREGKYWRPVSALPWRATVDEATADMFEYATKKGMHVLPYEPYWG